MLLTEQCRQCRLHLSVTITVPKIGFFWRKSTVFTPKDANDRKVENFTTATPTSNASRKGCLEKVKEPLRIVLWSCPLVSGASRLGDKEAERPLCLSRTGTYGPTGTCHAQGRSIGFCFRPHPPRQSYVTGARSTPCELPLEVLGTSKPVRSGLDYPPRYQ